MQFVSRLQVLFNLMKSIATLAGGFKVFANCFSGAECDAVAEAISDVEVVGSRCLLDCRWCQDLASTMQDKLAAMLPELLPLSAVQCTYFNKSKTSNWFVAFHQDRSIPVASTASEDLPGWSQKEGMTFIHGSDHVMAEMLALRLHIDDSTDENGPLRVLPNSHNAGILDQRQINFLRETTAEQKLIVSKGSVIAMRPLLLHASSKSRIETSRRVLHFLFGPNALPGDLRWRKRV